jgi:hypothetical protein
MNSYRKLVSQRNKKKQNKKKQNKKKQNNMSKTLKRHYMSKKSRKIKSNKKFRNRYQIGCSKKNNMKGGGVSPFQAFPDTLNAITSTGGNVLSAFLGTSSTHTPNPTDQPHL